MGITSSLDNTNTIVGRLVGNLIFPEEEEGEGDTVIPSDLYMNYTKDDTKRALSLYGYLGNGTIFQKPIDILFGSGSTQENYRLASFVIDDGENTDAILAIDKETEAGVVSLELNPFDDGVVIYSDVEDASILKVDDLFNELVRLDIRTNGVLMPNLPTSDPLVADQLWVDNNGFLKVSAGT
jgi:hypothetical protein